MVTMSRRLLSFAVFSDFGRCTVAEQYQLTISDNCFGLVAKRSQLVCTRVVTCERSTRTWSLGCTMSFCYLSPCRWLLVAFLGVCQSATVLFMFPMSVALLPSALVLCSYDQSRDVPSFMFYFDLLHHYCVPWYNLNLCLPLYCLSPCVLVALLQALLYAHAHACL